ncbi:MAG: sigma 54-interacting transcriptional regulator [Bradymonadia bacterium]
MPSLVQHGRSAPSPLVRRLTSIGSDPENDIVVDADGVLSTHAHVKLESGRFLLVALHRSAPVMVNGRKIKKHVLEHGDEIAIGAAGLRFNLWDEPGTQERDQDEGPGGDVMGAYKRLVMFSTTLAERLDVPTLLEALMDEIIALTGADKGFLLLMEEAPKVVTARNLKRENVAATLNQLSDSIIRRVIEGRQPIIVSDALHDTEFKSSVSVVQLRLCSVMCVPLVFRGQLLGLIYVGNDNVVNLFDEHSLEQLTVFATQAALLLDHAIQRDALQRDNKALRTALEGSRFGSIIGACDPMRGVFRTLEKVAVTDINVLVLGETGTGKELIARELHRRSARKDGPFVAVNCGALPADLMESELFGHRRGAFTGAVEDKKGRFQAAHKGTLFLDEIGEMPAALQVKLLRAIQDRTVTRVGDNRPQPVDIRLVAATHVDLQEAIREGRFREDLYYRLNVVSITLPALRERDEDVVLIARYLLERYAKEYDRKLKGFTSDALIAMRKHAWPGNIRELENRLKKAVVLAEGTQLGPDDLDLGEEALADRILPLAEAKEAFQRRYIDQVLALNNHNRTKTARDLGVDPRTIFRHLEKTRGE